MGSHKKGMLPRRCILATALATNAPRRALRLAGVTAEGKPGPRLPPQTSSEAPGAVTFTREPWSPISRTKASAD